MHTRSARRVVPTGLASVLSAAAVCVTVAVSATTPAVASGPRPTPGTGPHGLQEPGNVYRVQAGDSLSTLAARVYGDASRWPAIMLATNHRLAELPELRFIGDPNVLVPGESVWVPVADEAAQWNARYDAYRRAVADMTLAEPWEVVHDLVSIGPGPVHVVSWARDGAFRTGTQNASSDVWVTVDPHLRDFCREQARTLSDDELVRRLEQRLGLPPASNKTVFVEIVVDDPAAIFRPCADPRTDTTTCPLGPPAESLDQDEHLWFYRQYYDSYGQARPTQYPWTSLGYTYDWADNGSEVGESEFVIRGGASITVASITPTREYCAAR